MYQATDVTSRAMLRLSRLITWTGGLLLSAILLCAALLYHRNFQRDRSGS